MAVVVVGGGIIGLASAYYLSQRGVSVTVVEQAGIGTGSTGRANGGIRAQFTSPVSIRLSQASIEVWEAFESEFGVDIGYFQPGYLFLARTPGTAEQLRENVATQATYGVPSDYLDPSVIEERWPAIETERFAGGAYSPQDGIADPSLALQGYAQGATAAGVEIQTGVTVTDVCQDGTGVTGVETTTGRIEADYVVNASGPWAHEIAAMAGLDLPVTPKRRQLAVIAPEQPISRSVPFVVDMDGDAHFRPERDGNAVIGGFFAGEDPPVDPDSFSPSMDFAWAATALDHVSEIADYFGPDSRITDGWAGLYAVTPDHHPIIEETMPGFVNAVGFSGHGFMQSPATGRLVAELVSEGTASLVDISSLTAARFEQNELLEEGTVID